MLHSGAPRSERRPDRSLAPRVEYSLPRRVGFGFLGVFVNDFAANEAFGGGFFGDLVEAGEGFARMVCFGLASCPGVSAGKSEMNPRFVGGEASRDLQFLDGSCVLAHFKKNSAEDVMSERQTGVQLDGLLRVLQSRFGLFVSHVDECDLKPGQSVVRRVFDL